MMTSMNYSQKYAIVAFLEPIEVGVAFNMTDWPQHITIVDVFAVEHDENLNQLLAGLIAQHLRIHLTIGHEATLGTTDVLIVNKNDKLQDLHDEVVNLLESNGAVFNNPEFTHQGFLPHSTIQKAGNLKSGDNITISTLALVDMFPDGNWQHRKVLACFELAHI